jgi:hypothetical protein
MMGRPNCSSVMPLARQRLRAPAMRRPMVVVALRKGIAIFFTWERNKYNYELRITNYD